MAQVQALHFLQKNNIGIEFTQAFAQLVYHHLPVELREALVDVVSGDAQDGLGCSMGQCVNLVVFR